MGCGPLYVSIVTPAPHALALQAHQDLLATGGLAASRRAATPATATPCPPPLPPQFTPVRSALTAPIQQTDHKMKILCYNVCAQIPLTQTCIRWSMQQFGGRSE